MNFSNKNILIILLFGLIIGSAYAIVSKTTLFEPGNATVAESEAAPDKPNTTAITSTPADTSKTVTTRFPIKKFTQNTYDELNAKYPLDAPKPSNVKSVVQYDVKTGNYVLRTFVGENEIATPFLMTEQEYKNFSAKKEMQSYWQ